MVDALGSKFNQQTQVVNQVINQGTSPGMSYTVDDFLTRQYYDMFGSPKRLNMNPTVSEQEFKRLMLAFAHTTAAVESGRPTSLTGIFSRQSNNVDNKAGRSTAQGYYQFTTENGPTALNRLFQMGADQQYVKQLQQQYMTGGPDMKRLSKEDQTLVFFGNLFAQKGSDIAINNFLTNPSDPDIMAHLYLGWHHSSPTVNDSLLFYNQGGKYSNYGLNSKGVMWNKGGNGPNETLSEYKTRIQWFENEANIAKNRALKYYGGAQGLAIDWNQFK